MATAPSGKVVGRGPSHVFVAEEYPVYVPMLRPNEGLLNILETVGARHKSYTQEEITNFIKEYICSRRLYNTYNPIEVICRDDPLGKVFGVEKFTVKDVICLIHQNCYKTEDACIKHQVFTRPIPISTRNGQNGSRVTLTSSNAMAATNSHPSTNSSQVINTSVISSTNTESVVSSGTSYEEGASSVTETSKRKLSHAEESSNTKHVKVEEKSQFPWYFHAKIPTDESEVLSIQDKETATIKDSSDDLWFLDEESVTVEVNPTDEVFSIEYEVESDHTDVVSHSDSSSKISGKDVLVVCRDSDMEFWADSSGDESYSELKDDDWTCEECYTNNSALQRYCFRCWKLRPGWLPEQSVPRKSKKSKESNKAASNISSDSESGSAVRKSKEGSDVTNSEVGALIAKTKNSTAADLGISSDSEGETGLIKKKSQRKKDAESAKACDSFDSGVAFSSLDSKSPEFTRRTFLNYQSTKDNISAGATSLSTSSDCIICFSQPKTGSLIHGSTGHQVCCYKCAKRLKRRREPCPVCRKPIQKVIRNFLL